MKPIKIVVFIKQVPDTNEVRIDPKTGTLIRDGVPSIINPDDKNALEGALRIKDLHPDASITVITMGPPQADVALREALAMGCDEAILISDRAVAGSDTWATSSVLAAAAKKVGDYDLIFAGRQAIDGDTAQVGPQVAEKLEIPQVTYVSKVELKDGYALVHRSLEDGYHVIKVGLPCVLTAIGDLGKPRYSRFPGVYRAYQAEIACWGIADLQLDKKETGLNGSPTKVYQTFTPKVERAGVKFESADRETMASLVSQLRDRHVI